MAACSRDVIDTIIGILVASVSLVIALAILLLSVYQLKSQEIQNYIKIIHFASCVSGIVALSTGISYVYSCSLVLVEFHIIGYFAELLFVLAMLLMRLYFSFKDSVFAITECQKWICVFLYSLIIISVIVQVLQWRIDIVIIHVIMLSVGALLYFGLSMYGMIIFAQKMYQLLKMRQSSILSQNSSSEMQLNQQQIALLYTTTKYTLLLSIAMISTWISGAQGLYYLLYSWTIETNPFGFIISSIDIVTNIICLYLQFPFNKKYYDKYCKCLVNCCTYIMTMELKRRHNKDTKFNEMQLENVVPMTLEEEDQI